MSETIARQKVVVTNPQGLHLRPAYKFVELAGKFDATIEIIKDAERVDGKSILDIATLAIENGTEVEIEATGQDAEDAISALVELVEKDFRDSAASEATEENN